MPNPRMTAALTNTDIIIGSCGTQKKMERRAAKPNAMPPIRGIGLAWTFLSPGRSMKRQRPAFSCSGGINAMQMNSEVMKLKKTALVMVNLEYTE